MKKLTSILLILFALAWGGALVLYFAGTFGWFGGETDPLSAAFLLPLGLPWVRGVDLFPERLWPWLAALSPGINPGINLAILALIQRWVRAR